MVDSLPLILDEHLNPQYKIF